MKRKKQGYDDRLDESLGMKHKETHSQSFKDRRDESAGMDKRDKVHRYASDHQMDEGDEKSHHHHMMTAHHKFMARHHRKKSYSK